MVRSVINCRIPSCGKGMVARHTRGIRGEGVGSVLLNKGGAGAGSSYDSLDEYIHTTGRNPYAQSSGRGIGGDKFKASLESLNIKPPTKKPKAKNINFSL